jgi:hypothetical protein
MNLRQFFTEWRRGIAAFGWRSMLPAFALRALKRLIDVQVLRAMYISAVPASFGPDSAGVTAKFLSADTLRMMSADPRYDLTPDFLDEALAKGDECFGIVDGDELAAYGWYAHTPTKLADDLRLHFDDRYVYMYKGFTLESHRGRRLHAIGMTGALAAYRARGYKGLVSYVEADNLNSLKSTHRMSYIDFGRVLLWRVGKRHLILRTPGCATFGFRVESIRTNSGPVP